MRTEMRSDKFSSDLNKWIYDEQIRGISISNIDCVVSRFSAAGDDIKVIEFKHMNEPDRPMQEALLRRLAQAFRAVNDSTGSRYGVYKIRGELPFNSVELHDYITGDVKTISNEELREFVGDVKDDPDFSMLGN